MVSELANMICGSLLSRVKTETQFPFVEPRKPRRGKLVHWSRRMQSLICRRRGWRRLARPVAGCGAACRLTAKSACCRGRFGHRAQDPHGGAVGQPDLEVVGTAPDPYVARDKILALKPDVLTLDIEMPRMDGLTFLKKLMHFHPMPVMVISSLAQASCQTAMQALELGAVEVLAKPGRAVFGGGVAYGHWPPRSARAAAARLASAGRLATSAAVPLRQAIRRRQLRSIVAIGASTGGTEAIAEVLPKLPQGFPAS